MRMANLEKKIHLAPNVIPLLAYQRQNKISTYLKKYQSSLKGMTSMEILKEITLIMRELQSQSLGPETIKKAEVLVLELIDRSEKDSYELHQALKRLFHLLLQKLNLISRNSEDKRGEEEETMDDDPIFSNL